MFPAKEDYNAQSERLYKLDHTRVKKLEDDMAKLQGQGDLAALIENLNKRIAKCENLAGENSHLVGLALKA